MEVEKEGDEERERGRGWEVGVGDRNGLTDRQADRQTDRQADRPTDRQTEGREREGGGEENKNTRMLIHVYKQQEVRGRAMVTR